MSLPGEALLGPLLDDFIDRFPDVSVRLHMLDRPANLIDEGIDVALRIAHLADSTLVALRVGEVRRVVAASPRYLARHRRLSTPADLADHEIIAMTHFGLDSWSFPPVDGSTIPRTVQFAPRFVANDLYALRSAALEGLGLTMLPEPLVRQDLAQGRLVHVLPQYAQLGRIVHVVFPPRRGLVPAVRGLIDALVEGFAQRIGPAPDLSR